MAENRLAMTGAAAKNLRTGSVQKHSAILAAAGELFLADGFDRTKMDEIAVHARVSKRTVYDYYGDKRTLFLAVVDQALTALRSTVHQAIDGNLVDVEDLEEALIGFARSVTASALGSSDYAALMRLLSMESAKLPELHDDRWSTIEPEHAVAERFADFHRHGLLEAPDPRLATDHFVALTILPLTQSRSRARSDAAETERVIVEGVRAFLRAYEPGERGLPRDEPPPSASSIR